MTSVPPKVRHVVGVMTGTSIDGIDAALVRIEGSGLSMSAKLLQHISRPLGNIGTQLRSAAQQKPMTAGEFARLAWEFGELHANVIAELMETLPSHSRQNGGVDLICVHGQTVFHQPPISWQIVNPAPIAQRFGCPIISDLRQADLAAGGQGAPITPIADWILFRDPHQSRAIVNLGGFCNVTILPAAKNETDAPTARAAASSPRVHPDDVLERSLLSKICGFDVCACNQILDAVARTVLNKPFDVDGVAALRGCAQPQAARTLLEILERQRHGQRSLGTGDEAMQWLAQIQKDAIAPDDLVASAVVAIARCIGSAISSHQINEIILAGGGARNGALVQAIAQHAKLAAVRSDELGVPIEAREAMCFAALGALCADGVPITLPQVTGCGAPAPISGQWTIRAGRPVLNHD